MEYFSKELKGL